MLELRWIESTYIDKSIPHRPPPQVVTAMLRRNRNRSTPNKLKRFVVSGIAVVAASTAIGLTSAQAITSHPASHVGSQTSTEVTAAAADSEELSAQSAAGAATTTVEGMPAIEQGSSGTATSTSASSTEFADAKDASEVSNTPDGPTNSNESPVERQGTVGIRVASARGIASASKPETGQALQGGELKDGIVTPEQDQFFLPDISITSGGAAGFQLALRNTSKERQIVQITVRGLPESIRIEAISLEGADEITVIPRGPNSVLVDLPAALEPEGFNVEIQLIAEGLIDPGEYEPSISITSMPG